MKKFKKPLSILILLVAGAAVYCKFWGAECEYCPAFIIDGDTVKVDISSVVKDSAAASHPAVIDTAK